MGRHSNNDAFVVSVKVCRQKKAMPNAIKLLQAQSSVASVRLYVIHNFFGGMEATGLPKYV